MSKNIPKKPEWWPINPYPEDIFTATIEDYKKVIPDENTRTAISGYLGRRFWDLASESIWEALILSSGKRTVSTEWVAQKIMEHLKPGPQASKDDYKQSVFMWCAIVHEILSELGVEVKLE